MAAENAARSDDRGPVRRVVDPLTEFLQDEAAGGVALLVATAAALVWANVSGDGYASFWHREPELGFGDAALHLDLRHWVNDALMALFFFVVGLEIKRELVTGELQDRRAATLPVVAAIGGVALPALIFVAVTAGTPQVSGWAIPAATDIAFAVGVLALLGDRVSSGAKLFLLTVAIVDDIAAIAIIALFYSESLAAGWLAVAAAGLVGVVAFRALGVARILAYVPLALLVWVAIHESGVHATIAGVALGLLTPTGRFRGRPIMAMLEHRLHVVSAFVIVPLFALANAGVNLGGGVIGDALSSRLAWAIAAGLALGKLLGIAGATFMGLRLGWGTLPDGVARAQVWGLAALGGIGFTVSLFIAQLAYDEAATVDTAKVGIFAGSLVSGVLGAALLARRPRAVPVGRTAPEGRSPSAHRVGADP
jgi:Na+:H+ antiporter, NhaA family